MLISAIGANPSGKTMLLHLHHHIPTMRHYGMKTNEKLISNFPDIKTIRN